MADFPVQVTTAGPVPGRAEDYAIDKIGRLGRFADRSVLMARVSLSQGTNPAVERSATAKASLDVSGRVVRAHVAAETMDMAIDTLEERLRRQLDRISELRGHPRGPAEPEAGEWQHGAAAGVRPPYYPRPVEEREVIVTKTFALTPLLPEEAALEMLSLDHDFYLFTDSHTHEDAVVHRREDGSLALMQITPDPERESVLGMDMVVDPAPVATLSHEQATQRLDVGGEPFVFHTDRETGRGTVLYRRYDGHYGRIVPAEAP